MRRIAVTASLLALLGLAACDDNKGAVQTAQPVAQLPPPNYAPPPSQAPAPTYSQERRRSYSRSEESYEDSQSFDEDRGYSDEDSYDENERSDDAAIDARERRDISKRAVAHLWTDGFGRQHVSTSGEEDYYANRAANDPINSKAYRDPWLGYDKDCKR